MKSSGKANKYIRELFEANENEVESIRLKTSFYEMVIAQDGNFIIVATQAPQSKVKEVEGVEGVVVEGGEKKEEAKAE